MRGFIIYLSWNFRDTFAIFGIPSNSIDSVFVYLAIFVGCLKLTFCVVLSKSMQQYYRKKLVLFTGASKKSKSHKIKAGSFELVSPI